jgi:hypothetical protein
MASNIFFQNFGYGRELARQRLRLAHDIDNVEFLQQQAVTVSSPSTRRMSRTQHRRSVSLRLTLSQAFSFNLDPTLRSAPSQSRTRPLKPQQCLNTASINPLTKSY